MKIVSNSPKLVRGLLIGLIVCVLGLSAASIGAGVAYSGLKEASGRLDQLQGEKEQLLREREELTARGQKQDEQIASLEDSVQSLEEQLKGAQDIIGQLKDQITILQGQTEPYQPTFASMPDGNVVLQLRKPTLPSDARLVALTFDDGPGKYTERLLDELKARGIPATFFVVGRNAVKYTDLLKRMIDEGHVVGNHTMNHKNLTKQTAETVLAEIGDSADIIEQATGIRPYLLRSPGGNINDEVKAVLKEEAVLSVNWSVDTRDWESKDKEKILETAFQEGRYGIQDGAIVLMHDIYETSVDAAVEMMDRLIAEGYTFVTVPDLLAARNEVVLAGVTYTNGAIN